MASAPTLPLVSVEEYLNTSYHPDREYVDGVLVERHVGERRHSRLQGLLINFLMSREGECAILAYPEQRIYVRGKRWRVPDVCVMSADHKKEDVFTEAPLLLIEVLSREDEMGEVLDKCEDYHTMGVRNIIVADPYRKRLFVVNENGRLSESESLTPSFEVSSVKAPLRINFEDLFKNLD